MQRKPTVIAVTRQRGLHHLKLEFLRVPLILLRSVDRIKTTLINVFTPQLDHRLLSSELMLHPGHGATLVETVPKPLLKSSEEPSLNTAIPPTREPRQSEHKFISSKHRSPMHF